MSPNLSPLTIKHIIYIYIYIYIHKVNWKENHAVYQKSPKALLIIITIIMRIFILDNLSVILFKKNCYQKGLGLPSVKATCGSWPLFF